MNIFLFRWYLVFLIFWIRGLGRSEHASVTLDLLCVSNAQGTPLIDDNVTHLCYYTMYNIGPENVLFTLWVCNPLIHGIITHICDIIIYKRGPLSVAHIEIQRDPREY